MSLSVFIEGDLYERAKEVLRAPGKTAEDEIVELIRSIAGGDDSQRDSPDESSQ